MYSDLLAQVCLRLSGIPNQHFLSFSFFFYTSTVPWSFLCQQFLSFNSLTGWKVPELWGKNGFFFVLTCCHTGFNCLRGNVTICTPPPLRIDIPFGEAPRCCCRFTGDCGSQKEWLTMFLKGWAVLRPSVKVGHHLRRFLSCWVARRQWRKETEFKLRFAESLPKQVKLSNALPGEKSYLVKNLILGQKFIALWCPLCIGISFVEFFFRHYKQRFSKDKI